MEGLLLECSAASPSPSPRWGTVAATRRPIVLLTSNATRGTVRRSKRRCLYLYIDFPDAHREREIPVVAGPPNSATRCRRRSWDHRRPCAPSTSGRSRRWPRRSTGPIRCSLGAGDGVRRRAKLDDGLIARTLGWCSNTAPTSRRRSKNSNSADDGHRAHPLDDVPLVGQLTGFVDALR